jgi:hypothetical protein
LWHDHLWFFVIHLGDEAFIRGVNETSNNTDLDQVRKKVVGLCSLISPALKEGDTAIMQKYHLKDRQLAVWVVAGRIEARNLTAHVVKSICTRNSRASTLSYPWQIHGRCISVVQTSQRKFHATLSTGRSREQAKPPGKQCVQSNPIYERRDG